MVKITKSKGYTLLIMCLSGCVTDNAVPYRKKYVENTDSYKIDQGLTNYYTRKNIIQNKTEKNFANAENDNTSSELEKYKLFDRDRILYDKDTVAVSEQLRESQGFRLKEKKNKS